MTTTTAAPTPSPAAQSRLNRVRSVAARSTYHQLLAIGPAGAMPTHRELAVGAGLSITNWPGASRTLERHGLLARTWAPGTCASGWAYALPMEPPAAVAPAERLAGEPLVLELLSEIVSKVEWLMGRVGSAANC